MDKIILKNLGFYGYHGVLNEEKILGQKFFIDVELFLDLSTAGNNDDLEHTVSYADVYKMIKELFEQERYKLIEAVGEEICARVLTKFPLVQEIWLYLRKPEAPVAGIYDHFGIQLRRKRNA